MEPIIKEHYDEYIVLKKRYEEATKEVKGRAYDIATQLYRIYDELSEHYWDYNEDPRWDELNICERYGEPGAFTISVTCQFIGEQYLYDDMPYFSFPLECLFDDEAVKARKQELRDEILKKMSDKKRNEIERKRRQIKRLQAELDE